MKLIAFPNIDSENRTPVRSVRVSRAKAAWISRKSRASMVSRGGSPANRGVNRPRWRRRSVMAIRIEWSAARVNRL